MHALFQAIMLSIDVSCCYAAALPVLIRYTCQIASHGTQLCTAPHFVILRFIFFNQQPWLRRTVSALAVDNM